MTPQAVVISPIRCSDVELLNFTKQLFVLLSSGIQLSPSMTILSESGQDSLSRKVLPWISTHLASGRYLSWCLKTFPQTFPPTYVALIKSGEETGRLVYVLGQLGLWLERRDRLNRVVKKALTYPLFVTVITAVLTVALFRSVIPAILKTVVDLGVELPWPTRLLMGLVDLAGSPITWVVAVLVLVGLIRYACSEQGYRRVLDVSCYVPGLGPVLIGSACSRFANTMAMLVGNGVDVVRACRISCEASGLPRMEEDATRLIMELSNGELLSKAIASSKLYPNVLGAMLGVGEESGRVTEVLGKCAQILEEDALDRVGAFTNLLEPIVLGFLSLGVGFIVIAVMLPISMMVNAL